MKKTKKLKNPNKDQAHCIEFIKEYLNNYVYANSDAVSVDFREEKTDSNICFLSTVAYPNFKAVIKYDDTSFLNDNNIDIFFKYENSEYYFSVYDIFNYFDINDFKKYYYPNCIGDKALTYALDSLTDLVYRYYKDIERAGNSENLPYLVKQYEQDKQQSNGDEWREDIDFNDPDGIDFSHISFLTTTAKTKEKLVKRLEKYNSKNSLVLYEKRLLEYLKSGNDMALDDGFSEKCEKTIKKISFKVNGIIILAVLITYIIVELVGLRLYFGTGYVDNEIFFTLAEGLFFPKPMIIIPFVFSCSFFISVFSKRFIYKACPEDVKEYYITKQKNETGYKKINQIMKNFVSPVIILLVSLLLFFVINCGVSFTENTIRVHDMPFTLYEISYDDIELYRVKQYYDTDEDKMITYEGNRYVLAWKDNYYEMAECDDLSKTDKLIKELCSEGKLNPAKEINDIEYIYDLYEYNG